MSNRTPTTQKHWERYADELLRRVEQAERERDKAKPVLEAARLQARSRDTDDGTKGPLSVEAAVYARDCERTEQCIRAYDAARAAGKEE